MLGKLVVKYVPIYPKGTLIKTTAKDLSNNAYAMFLYVFFFFFLFVFFFVFFFNFLYEAYVVGTHLNCIDKSTQFK